MPFTRIRYFVNTPLAVLHCLNTSRGTQLHMITLKACSHTAPKIEPHSDWFETGVIKVWGPHGYGAPPAPFHWDIGAPFVHLVPPLAPTVYRPAKCNKTKSTTIDVLIDFKPGPLRPLVPRTVATRTAKSARKRPSYRVVSTAIALASSF